MSAERSTPSMRYRVILADPPWDYGKSKPRKQAHRGGNPQSHYKTMSQDELGVLPVREWSADNAGLFMWVTNPKLALGLWLMEEWGFQYQTTLTWVKVSQDGSVDRGGLGFYFRGATEHILFGTRGRFAIPTDKRLPNVIHARKQGHSRKPDELHEIIELISPGPYLEMFARRSRLGWDAWGNEVPLEALPSEARPGVFDLRKALGRAPTMLEYQESLHGL